MKTLILIISVIILMSCHANKYNGEFDCYSEAINILFKRRSVDTVYLATNFPNFKVYEDEFPEQIFYYNDLDENQNKYIEILPNRHFWNFHLLDKVKTVVNKKNSKEVNFARFNYSFKMKLDENPNLGRTFLTFSPIYYNEENDKGFFIVSEINNINIGFTDIFYICKNNNSYEIFDQISVHRFMPY
jgi:hypothetical protein